jgi:hypothetical protein
MKPSRKGTPLNSSAKQATQAEARSCATLRFNGTGSRAGALVRRGAPILEVRILENPEDFFEDAHHFSKVRTRE